MAEKHRIIYIGLHADLQAARQAQMLTAPTGNDDRHLSFMMLIIRLGIMDTLCNALSNSIVRSITAISNL